MQPGDEAFEPDVDELSSQPEASSSAEPVEVEQPVGEPAAAAEPEPAARPDHMPPMMSAAETLERFDPFADTAEAEPMSMPAVDAAATPNEPLAEFSTGMATPTRQTPLSTSAQSAAPTRTPAPESSARRSLEDLFPDTPVNARTDAAAETLASAFGRSEPQGRPTRAASNELSLDHVFRGAPEGAPAPDGGFSFDQFFSDSQTAGGDAAAAAAAPESGRGGGSADAHDIEQFTAWLEGLKKK
jgi:hypothetical protein